MYHALVDRINLVLTIILKVKYLELSRDTNIMSRRVRHWEVHHNLYKRRFLALYVPQVPKIRHELCRKNSMSPSKPKLLLLIIRLNLFEVDYTPHPHYVCYKKGSVCLSSRLSLPRLHKNIRTCRIDYKAVLSTVDLTRKAFQRKVDARSDILFSRLTAE